MLNIRTGIPVILAALALSFPALAADKGEKLDKTKQRLLEEAKIAAEEEAAEGAMPLEQRPQTVFTGRLFLSLEAPADNPDVVGSFASEDGRVFLVKLTSPRVLSDIRPLDQKKTTLRGTIRVNGKYLVLNENSVTKPGPARRVFSKRGGS